MLAAAVVIDGRDGEHGDGGRGLHLGMDCRALDLGLDCPGLRVGTDCRGVDLGMDGWGLGSGAVGGFGFVLERDRLRELMRVAVGLFLGRLAVSADAVGRAGPAVVVPDAAVPAVGGRGRGGVDVYGGLLSAARACFCRGWSGPPAPVVEFVLDDGWSVAIAGTSWFSCWDWSSVHGGG